MDTSNVDRILAAWDQVADARPRPPVAPRPAVARGGFSMTSLVGLGIVATVIMVAVVSLGRPRPDDGVGTIPTAAPSATASATPTVVPTATPTPSAAASLSALPACRADQLVARITSWEGAAGHRIADVELANTSQAPCVVPVWTRPQLVDGNGTVLIEGADQVSPSTLTFVPGTRLATLVQDGDYCGPAPVAPVTVAFLVGDVRVVATPVTPTDTTVPPCLSSPGSAGTIEMQGWSK